jgi:AbrB family looped-hinge helix DNA binding protein
MRITSKGQVTIPIEIRNTMGLLPNTDVEFVIKGKQVTIQKTTAGNSRGQRIVEAMRGKGTVSMSTDEIMALTRGE